MVTLNRHGGKANKSTSEFCGLSSDKKPTDVFIEGTITTPVLNGSTFFEIDTGNLYTFSEESAQWSVSSSGTGVEPLPTAQNIFRFISSVVESTIGTAEKEA